MQFRPSRVGIFSVVAPVIEEDEILKAEALKSEVVSLIEMGRTHVAADLTHLGYVSSEIIGVLISLHKIASRLPGMFVVIVSNDNLIEIMRRTGVTEILRLVRDLKELQAESTRLEATLKNTPSEPPKSEFDLLRQEMLAGGAPQPESTRASEPAISIEAETLVNPPAPEPPLELSVEVKTEPETAPAEPAPPEPSSPAPAKVEDDFTFDDATFTDALEEGLQKVQTEEPKKELKPEPPKPEPIKYRPQSAKPTFPFQGIKSASAPDPKKRTISLRPVPRRDQDTQRKPSLAEKLAADEKEAAQPVVPVPAKPVEKPKAVELEIREDKPAAPSARVSKNWDSPPQDSFTGIQSPARPTSQVVLQPPVYRSARKTEKPASRTKDAQEEPQSSTKTVIISVAIALACLGTGLGTYKLLGYFKNIRSGISDVVTNVANQQSSLAQVEKMKQEETSPPASESAPQQPVEDLTSPKPDPEASLRKSVEPTPPKPSKPRREKATPAPVREKPRQTRASEPKPEPKQPPPSEPRETLPAAPQVSAQPASASGTTGILFIASNPAVADIYYNGQKVGSTNVTTMDLPVGEVTLVFKKGGLSLTKKFQIKPGKNESQFIYLSEGAQSPAQPAAAGSASMPEPAKPEPKPAPAPAPKVVAPAPQPAPPPPSAPAQGTTGQGKVFICTMPQLAEIIQNGHKIGTANESNLTLPVGKIKLTFKKGKLTKTQEITVREGENDPIYIQME